MFKQLIEDKTPESFGIDDLYAAYHLHKAATKYEFGPIGIKQSKHKQRGPTRFLFYMIVIEFLKFALIEARRGTTNKEVTRACIKIFQLENEEALSTLLNAAVGVIDEYMKPSTDSEFSIEKEPNFTNTQSYLRHTKLGSRVSSPFLNELLERDKRFFKQSRRGEKSECDRVAEGIEDEKQ